MKASKLFLILSTLFSLNSHSQTCNILSDDYSDPSLWTKICATNVNEISIGSNVLRYVNSSDGHEERLFRTLPVTLNSNDDWQAEVDFYPIAAGVNGCSGHLPLAITAGQKDPLSHCTDPTNCGPNGNYSNQDQDGIIVFYGTLPPNLVPGINTFFQLHIKDGKQEWISRVNGIKMIQAPLNKQYKVRLQKCSDMILLHVEYKGNPLPNSPIVAKIPIDYDVQGLNTVQHSNSSRGVVKRKLTALVDNLCIQKVVNNKPWLSGIGGQNSKDFSATFYACETNQCINFYSGDIDPNQNLTISPAFPLPQGATFQQSTGSRPTGTFCWNPGPQNVGVHYFTFKVEDDHCTPALDYFTYKVEVLGGYNLGSSISICNNASPLSLPDPGPGVWSVTSPVSQALNGNVFDPSSFLPGVYTLNYCTPKPGYLSTCSGCWQIKIEVLESPVISIQAIESSCNTDPPFQISASPIGGQWSGGPYISPSGIFSPILASTNSLPPNPVTYTVIGSNGCTSSSTIYVPVYQNGLSSTEDLGTHCLDEYFILPVGGYKYELNNVVDLNTGSPPSWIPTLPLALPGRVFLPAQFPNYFIGGSNISYEFKVYYKTSSGCEYEIVYKAKFISCACIDPVAQYISITTSTTDNMHYSFSFTPNIGSFNKLNRINWVLTDQQNNTLMALYNWNAGSSTIPSQLFNFDFTPYIGSLLPCGNYYVYLDVITEDSLGNLSFCRSVTMIFICCEQGFKDCNVGTTVPRDEGEMGLICVPNPTTDKVNIEIASQSEAEIEIRIFAHSGEVVFSKQERVHQGRNLFKYDLTSLNPGIYIIQATDGEVLVSEKLIKQ